MFVIETATGKKHKVDVVKVNSDELKDFTKKEFFFNWKLESGSEVYKLVLSDTNECLGLISIERMNNESFIYIRLLTVSVRNKGKNKQFDRVAGVLLGYMARLAFREYGPLACIALIPKTGLISHYATKYRMVPRGMMLSLEMPNILWLAKEYIDRSIQISPSSIKRRD